MIKLTRQTQQIFCGNAPTDELAQIGSMSKAPVYSEDLDTLQSNNAFQSGWQNTLINGKAPFLEERNSMDYITTRQLAYLFQQGIPEWDPNTTYYINSFVQVAGILYKSLTDNNINNAVTDVSYWEEAQLGGSSRNVGETVFSLLPLTDAGLHLLDGALLDGNGVYAAFVSYIAKLYGDGSNIPEYFTTEANWQTSVTNYGVCGKFVYNPTANTVRLPKVTGIVEGTLDANALGDLVQAGLPSLVSAGAHIKGFMYIVVANSTKTEVEVDIDNVVTDLNNQDGRISQLENVTLNKNQISNCVTEVPQNIKYTFENNVFTLLAGSKVVFPYGVEDKSANFPIGSTFLSENWKVIDTQFADNKFFVFAELQIDKSISGVSFNGSCYLLPMASPSLLAPKAISQCQSVNALPTYTAPVDIVYNFTTNRLHQYRDGAWDLTLCGFPVGICQLQTATPYITSVNNIFNGMGFFGQLTFVLPGVKALFAAGRNADGTLKNMEVTSNKVVLDHLINQSSQFCRLSLRPDQSVHLFGYGSFSYFEQANQPHIKQQHAIWYDTRNNYTFITGDYGATWAVISTIWLGKMEKPSAQASITSLTPDINPINLASPQLVKAFYSGTSGYALYNNGYCEQWGRITAQDAEIPITFLLPMADVNYNIGQSEIGAAGADMYVNGYRFVNLTTTGFTVSCRNNASKTCCWSIRGRVV